MALSAETGDLTSGRLRPPRRSPGYRATASLPTCSDLGLQCPGPARRRHEREFWCARAQRTSRGAASATKQKPIQPRAKVGTVKAR